MVRGLLLTRSVFPSLLCYQFSWIDKSGDGSYVGASCYIYIQIYLREIPIRLFTQLCGAQKNVVVVSVGALT